MYFCSVPRASHGFSGGCHGVSEAFLEVLRVLWGFISVLKGFKEYLDIPGQFFHEYGVEIYFRASVS